MPEQLLEPFPLKELPPRPIEEDDLAERVARLKVTQSNLIVQNAKGESSKNINRPGELYKRYRTVEELPSTAKAFYEIAGKKPLSESSFSMFMVWLDFLADLIYSLECRNLA